MYYRSARRPLTVAGLLLSSLQRPGTWFLICTGSSRWLGHWRGADARDHFSRGLRPPSVTVMAIRVFTEILLHRHHRRRYCIWLICEKRTVLYFLTRRMLIKHIRIFFTLSYTVLGVTGTRRRTVTSDNIHYNRTW